MLFQAGECWLSLSERPCANVILYEACDCSAVSEAKACKRFKQCIKWCVVGSKKVLRLFKPVLRRVHSSTINSSSVFN